MGYYLLLGISAYYWSVSRQQVLGMGTRYLVWVLGTAYNVLRTATSNSELTTHPHQILQGFRYRSHLPNYPTTDYPTTT